MKKRINETLAMLIAFSLLIGIPTGCGNSEDRPSLEDLPLYPYATEGESMEQSGPGGFMSGKLAQFTTTDPFDDVMDFYTDALAKYDPQYISQTSELGRQTAISIPKKNGIISVSIQEYTEEEIVNITFMAVGI
jgi:hypothetical protein